MDYEKEYKKLKADIRKAYLYAQTDSTKAVLKSILPELTESKDERIRKELIEYVKDQQSCFISAPDCRDKYEEEENNKYNSWIAWLEKQNEQKPYVVDFKAEDWYVSKVDGKIYNAKFMEKTPTNQARKLEIEKAAMSATGIIEQEEWFIKGAEWSDKNPSYISSEKQSEQKPVPDWMPKFHEGDWVVFIATESIYQVEKIENYEYTLRHIWGGSLHLSFSGVELEEVIRGWTIQDAKDGDVLITNKKQPFIFNGHYDEDTEYIYAYCGISDFLKDDSFLPCDEEYKVWCTNENVCPATKEQRDLLFKKMKEAGYEWDAEKKELKLKKLAHQEVTKTSDQETSEWSEEDEKMLNSFLHKVEVCDLLTNKEDVWITKKIKSLRPQKQWKPTQEQLDALKWQVENVNESAWHYKATEELYNQLKEL